MAIKNLNEVQVSLIQKTIENQTLTENSKKSENNSLKNFGCIALEKVLSGIKEEDYENVVYVQSEICKGDRGRTPEKYF